MRELDRIDRKILHFLQDEPDLSSTALAERVGISQSPCWRRLNRLQHEGIIKGRYYELDRTKLGFDVVVFVQVKMGQYDREVFEAFERAACDIAEVQAVQLLLGDVDYRLRVVVRSIKEYDELVRDRLLKLPGVREIQSSAVLKEVKDSRRLPITIR